MLTCVLVLGLLFCTDMPAADPDFLVPDGYRAEILDPLDGRIAIPLDWKARRSTLADSVLWSFAKDFRADGSYETGLTIQLFVALRRKFSSPRIAAMSTLVDLRQRGKVIRECDPEEMPHFTKVCLEVAEDRMVQGMPASYHVLYTVAYSVEMDLMLLTVFGAPSEEWDAVVPITVVMSNIRLMGPMRFRR